VSLLQTAGVALLAGAAGGVAAAVAWWVLPRVLPARGEATKTGESESLRLLHQLDKDNGLVFSHLVKLSEKLERVHEDVTTALEAGATTAPGQQTNPGLDRERRDRLPAREVPPRYERLAGTQPAGRASDGSYTYQEADAGAMGAASLGAPEPGPGLGLVSDSANPASWDSLPGPGGPPPNATLVEAREDRIVSSSTYPPEAWLEPGNGPAERRLMLNPALALNENALRRLSTFFRFDGERAGSAYLAAVPAVIRWDDGARVGFLVSRGEARPVR
jgi:hypothetical protein